jgi:hypothetical protein
LFIPEVGKSAVALGNEEEGLQAFSFLADMVYQTHKIGLGREVTDPNGMACGRYPR